MVGRLKKKGRIQMKDRVVDVLGASINSSLKVPSVADDALPVCPLLAFEEITKGDFGVYVRDTTALQPHPLPLIASHLKVIGYIRPWEGPLVLSRFAEHSQSPRMLCRELRRSTTCTEHSSLTSEELLVRCQKNNRGGMFCSWLQFVTDTSAAECLAILRIRLQDAFARKVVLRVLGCMSDLTFLGPGAEESNAGSAGSCARFNPHVLQR